MNTPDRSAYVIAQNQIDEADTYLREIISTLKSHKVNLRDKRYSTNSELFLLSNATLIKDVLVEYGEKFDELGADALRLAQHVHAPKE